MPEGDTIHRTAASLRASIEGAPLTRFDAPGSRRRAATATAAAPVEGDRVDRVEARGKHLLIRFDGGATLHTHMRMHGSWHLYRDRDRWRRSPGAMVARLGVPAVEAVCFSAPVVELLSDAEVARHPTLSALGPDLCQADVDLDEAMRRVDRIDPTTEIGVALLDQTVACGVGNVYRSEVAWACCVDPRRSLHDVDGGLRRTVWSTASRLLRANLGTPRRATVPGGLSVYDRAGRPCPRCGASISTQLTGDPARRVWWCAGCQG